MSPPPARHVVWIQGYQGSLSCPVGSLSRNQEGLGGRLGGNTFVRGELSVSWLMEIAEGDRRDGV